MRTYTICVSPFQTDEEAKGEGEEGDDSNRDGGDAAKAAKANEGRTPSTPPRRAKALTSSSSPPSHGRGRGGGGELEGFEGGGGVGVLHKGDILGELPALGRPPGMMLSGDDAIGGEGRERLPRAKLNVL